MTPKANHHKYWRTDIHEANWIFLWNDIEGLSKFHDHQNQFLKQYDLMSRKYGILEPINSSSFENKPVDEWKRDFHVSTNEIPHFLGLLSLFINNEIRSPVFPVKMYEEIAEKWNSSIFYDANPLESKKQLLNPSYFEPLLKIRMNFERGGMRIFIMLCTDAFYSELDSIHYDNAASSLLNSSRFNSFLKAFEDLCCSFGMSGKQLENLHDDEGDKSHLFNENGILYEGEIYYWEDLQVLDLIPKIDEFF